MHAYDSVNMEVLLSALSQAKVIKLPVQGCSMQPFLKEGRDKVFISSVKRTDLCCGDIVVFKRGSFFVLHRVILIKNDSLTIMGDNELNPERNVDFKNVAAIVTAVQRGNIIIKPSSLEWKFYSKLYTKPLIRKTCIRLNRFWKGLTLSED